MLFLQDIVFFFLDKGEYKCYIIENNYITYHYYKEMGGET